METNTEFKLEEWDTRSDTSLFHLSFIIQILLPLRWIGWKNCSAHWYTKVLQGVPSSDEDKVIFLPTGSQAEGFRIPGAILRGSSPIKTEIFSDLDLLSIHKGMNFSTQKLSEPSDEFFGYLDFDHSPPGYVRLCLLTMPKNPSLAVYDEETGNHYYSSSNVSEYIFSSLKFTDSDGKNKTKHSQGPAVTITDFGDQMLGNDINVQPSNALPIDFVTAFNCTPWPEQAKSWEIRGGMSRWLDPDLVKSIIADGCHVVGVPSKTSLQPDIEWRLSFSASECRLAREAVTDHQRQCYIYLKMLRYQIMKKEVTALTSYVFKSVFLHCCEKLPVSHWKDYPGNCVLYMLDVLLECIHRKHVPTYFLPENNLVSHLNESEIQTAIKAIEKLRLDPITPVLDFTDDKCLLMQPLLGSFRMVITPVLEDMKQFRQHRNKLLSIKDGISGAIFTNCGLFLREHADGFEDQALRKHQEAVKCLAYAYTQWLHNAYPGGTLVSLINAYGLALSLDYSVRLFKAAVSLSDEYPEFTQCRNNLACMIHACAYANEGEVNTDYLNQAGELFEQAYSDNKGSAIDYVTFLLKQKEYERAKEILEHFLGNFSHLFDSCFIYSKKEIKTVDDTLRRHIEANGDVTGNAVSFACYYMVQCLCALDVKDKSEKIQIILHDLHQHQNNKKTECSFDFYEQAKRLSL